MDKDIDINSLMDKVVNQFSSVDGVIAIYIIDFDTMKISYDTFNNPKPTKEQLDLIKNSVKLFSNQDVETAYIEEKERLFIKRVEKSNIIITIVTNSESRMGNIFSLLKLV